MKCVSEIINSIYICMIITKTFKKIKTQKLIIEYDLFRCGTRWMNYENLILGQQVKQGIKKIQTTNKLD